MVRWIVFTAFTLPFLEIAGFVWIGSRMGLAFTLLWVLGAMVAGMLLLRRTGLQAVAKLRATLAEGTEPGHSMLDSACFAAAAMLLIVPGFVSDALALILVLPATRRWFLRRTAAHFETRVYGRRGPAGGVIHGQFTVVAEPEPEGPDFDGPEPEGQDSEEDVQAPRRIEPKESKTAPEGGRPIIDVDET